MSRENVSSDPLYTARATNRGGTSGEVEADGRPALPTGGPSPDAEGFNPEQLLAMAWSTCLNETLRTILRERRRAARKAGDAEAVRVAESIGEPEVIVEVALEPDPDGGYRFLPRARVSIPGIDPETTRELALAAHARCPVSKLLTAAGDHPVEVHVPGA